jgi:diguanylate cyclase (GGDEF)-like protein
VVLTGLLILIDGIRAFRGLPRKPRLLFFGVAAFTAAHGFWLFVRDDINARTAVFMLALTLCSLTLTWAMASDVPPRDRTVYWPTAAGFATMGIAALAKGCDALWGPPIQFWNGRSFDLVFLAATNVCVFGCAFGLSLANNLKIQRAIEMLARYDPLTRLPNRRHFEELLEGTKRRAFSTAGRIALIYCDVDDFKGINDELGHEGGDAALRMVGEKLRKLAAEKVFVARIGGDEFVLLLEDAPARPQLNGLVQHVRNAVDGEVEFGGKSAVVNISCGLAVYPDDVGSVADLVRLGDAAMYLMKQHGRVSSIAG